MPSGTSGKTWRTFSPASRKVPMISSKYRRFTSVIGTMRVAA